MKNIVEKDRIQFDAALLQDCLELQPDELDIVSRYYIYGDTVKLISDNTSIPIGKVRNAINRYHYLLKKQSNDPEMKRAKAILYPNK